MGTNSTGCTEWERDFDPVTEQPTCCPYCGGNEAHCDFNFATEHCSEMRERQNPSRHAKTMEASRNHRGMPKP